MMRFNSDNAFSTVMINVLCVHLIYVIRSVCKYHFSYRTGCFLPFNFRVGMNDCLVARRVIICFEWALATGLIVRYVRQVSR